MSLESRIIATITISTLEDLHVGSERELALSGTDSPIHLDPDGNPLIPGSSIRGVFRSHFTRLLQAIHDSADPALLQLLDNLVPTTDRDTEKAFQKADESGKDKIFEKIGIIDRLFGISGFASPLRITDAICVSNTDIRHRVHVSIDVGTGKAKKNALIDLEAVGVDSRFEFKMIYDHLSDPRMHIANKMFYVLLNQLSQTNGMEFFLGGWKSRGYGLCQLRLEKLEIFTLDDLLLGKEPDIYENSNAAKYITNQIKLMGVNP